MEQQLKESLTTLQTIITKIDALDQKMDGFKKRLTALEFKFSNCCNDIEKQITICQNEIDETKARTDNIKLFKG